MLKEIINKRHSQNADLEAILNRLDVICSELGLGHTPTTGPQRVEGEEKACGLIGDLSFSTEETSRVINLIANYVERIEFLTMVDGNLYADAQGENPEGPGIIEKGITSRPTIWR